MVLQIFSYLVVEGQLVAENVDVVADDLGRDRVRIAGVVVPVLVQRLLLVGATGDLHQKINK